MHELLFRICHKILSLLRKWIQIITDNLPKSNERTNIVGYPVIWILLGIGKLTAHRSKLQEIRLESVQAIKAREIVGVAQSYSLCSACLSTGFNSQHQITTQTEHHYENSLTKSKITSKTSFSLTQMTVFYWLASWQGHLTMRKKKINNSNNNNRYDNYV